MEHTQLKAQLFDLMNERQEMEERTAKAEREAKEYLLQIDDLRGELKTAVNIAERRSEMIRESVRENRKMRSKMAEMVVENRELRHKLEETAGGLTEEIIETVTQTLKRSIEKPTSGSAIKWF